MGSLTRPRTGWLSTSRTPTLPTAESSTSGDTTLFPNLTSGSLASPWVTSSPTHRWTTSMLDFSTLSGTSRRTATTRSCGTSCRTFTTSISGLRRLSYHHPGQQARHCRPQAKTLGPDEHREGRTDPDHWGDDRLHQELAGSAHQEHRLHLQRPSARGSPHSQPIQVERLLCCVLPRNGRGSLCQGDRPSGPVRHLPQGGAVPAHQQAQHLPRGHEGPDHPRQPGMDRLCKELALPAHPEHRFQVQEHDALSRG